MGVPIEEYIIITYETQRKAQIVIVLSLQHLCTVHIPQGTEQLYAKYIVVCASNEIAPLEIAAKSRREAVKLYGLILHHRGILNHLGGEPCCVAVKLAGHSTDDGQFFKFWRAAEKIYAECYISPKTVSFNF